MSGEILMFFELGVQIQDGQARKDIELFWVSNPILASQWFDSHQFPRDVVISCYVMLYLGRPQGRAGGFSGMSHHYTTLQLQI